MKSRKLIRITLRIVRVILINYLCLNIGLEKYLLSISKSFTSNIIMKFLLQVKSLKFIILSLILFKLILISTPVYSQDTLKKLPPVYIGYEGLFNLTDYSYYKNELEKRAYFRVDVPVQLKLNSLNESQLAYEQSEILAKIVCQSVLNQENILVRSVIYPLSDGFFKPLYNNQMYIGEFKYNCQTLKNKNLKISSKFKRDLISTQTGKIVTSIPVSFRELYALYEDEMNKYCLNDMKRMNLQKCEQLLDIIKALDF